MTRQTPLIDQLDAAEYETLKDAELLETSAAVERAAADVDEAAASAARADADRIKRDRLATEEALASEEAAARLDAELHEEAARDARSVAADANRRRPSVKSAAKQGTSTKRQSKNKK